MQIRATKLVNKKVICIETLEHWQRLKVYRIFLAQYLGKGKIELLCQEINSSTKMQLKTLPCWLISEIQLEKRLKSANGRRSTIVITVRNDAEALKLCFKGLRFEEALKVVKRYWKAGSSLVYISCAGVSHNYWEECKDRVIQRVICTGDHKAENYRYGVTGCTIKMDKICIHVIPKYTNCGGNH